MTGFTDADLDGAGPGVHAGDVDIFVMKFNPMGEIEWIRQFGSPHEDSALAIALDHRGNVYVTGQIGGDLDPNDEEIFREGEGDDDVFLMKLDEHGQVQWLRQFGATADDAGFGLAIDRRGNLYVVGYTIGDIDGNGPGMHAGAADIFLAAFDSVGNRRWIRQIGSSEDDVAYAVVTDDEHHGVYLTGFTAGSISYDLGPQVNAGGRDLIAMKFDKQGGLHWVRQLGTPGDDTGHAIAVDHRHRVYISGFVSGDLDGSGPDVHAGNSDLAVLKIRPNGDLLWSRQLGTAGGDIAISVAVDRSGAVYTTGYVSGDLDGSGPQVDHGGLDVAVVKLANDGATEWIHQFGTSHNDAGFHVQVDRRNQIYVTGIVAGDLDGLGPQTDAGGLDVFVMKSAQEHSE